MAATTDRNGLPTCPFGLDVRPDTAHPVALCHPDRSPYPEPQTMTDLPLPPPRWVDRFARAGYAAKGVVYLLIGVLALQAAAGVGGRTTGTSGALHVLLRQPLGRWLLALVAVGLTGCAAWRLYCAAADPKHPGRRDWKRAAVRVGYTMSALIHGGIAWQAARLALGWGGGAGDG